MWTGATTNLWFPSSQNHSAILHSAGQLLLPLPQGPPSQPQAFISELVRLQRTIRGHEANTSQTLRKFNQHPPLLRARGFLPFSRLLPPDPPSCLTMSPEFLLDPCSRNFLLHSPLSLISFDSESQQVQTSPTLKKN